MVISFLIGYPSNSQKEGLLKVRIGVRHAIQIIFYWIWNFLRFSNFNRKKSEPHFQTIWLSTTYVTQFYFDFCYILQAV